MHRRSLVWTLGIALAGSVLVTAQRAPTPAVHTTLIQHAFLIDGTGQAGRRADVRIAGDRILAVGALVPAAGEAMVDATGLALAPGFIDTHSHHAGSLDAGRDAVALLSQGVTTIVSGQDGSGIDLAAMFAKLERTPVSVNVASDVGHGSVRSRVMGKDFARAATPAEVAAMQKLVTVEMDAGALGLSSGLEYDPGIYSTPDEVLALAKVAGEAGGRYVSHIRSEDRWFWQALDEIITIGRVNKMPVQVSHIKLGMLDLWGQAEKAIGVLDRARASGVNVTADIYPYTYWQSNLGVLYPKRNFGDRAETEFVLAHVVPADGVIFNSFRGHPEYTGKTLAQIAVLRKTTHVQTLIDLFAEPGGESAGIVARGMSDTDVARLAQWPMADVCSDGRSTGLHPRGFGSFPKVLGPYVRDKKLFATEEAVRKMTSLAAANVGIANRGTVAPGMFADLVLFDAATVADRADFGHAQDQAVGIRMVWVNGQLVFRNGKTTGVFSGRPIRRGKKPVVEPPGLFTRMSALY